MTLARPEDLLTFTLVAQYRSFSRAARELYVSAAAVSQRISRLEKTMRTRLLVRTTSRVELTPAGRLVLSWAEDTSRSWDLLLHSVRAVDDRNHPPIRWPEEVVIGRAPGPVWRRLHTLLEQSQPSTRWRVRTTSDAQQAFDLLRAEQLDLVFWQAWPFVPTPDPVGVVSATVLRTPLRLLVSDQHPEASRSAPVDLCRFADEPFITRSRPEVQEAYRQICRNTGDFTPRIEHIVDDHGEVESLVAAGHGVDFGLTTVRPVRGVTRLRFTGAPWSRIVLSWQGNRTAPEVVDAVTTGIRTLVCGGLTEFGDEHRRRTPAATAPVTAEWPAGDGSAAAATPSKAC